MQRGRKLGFVSLLICIVIHIFSRMYCLCCIRMCGILSLNVWDYLYVVSVLCGMVSIIFILGVDWLLEKEEP